jgi:hypothetical protein
LVFRRINRIIHWRGATPIYRIDEYIGEFSPYGMRKSQVIE